VGVGAVVHPKAQLRRWRTRTASSPSHPARPVTSQQGRARARARAHRACVCSQLLVAHPPVACRALHLPLPAGAGCLSHNGGRGAMGVRAARGRACQAGGGAWAGRLWPGAAGGGEGGSVAPQAPTTAAARARLVTAAAAARPQSRALRGGAAACARATRQLCSTRPPAKQRTPHAVHGWRPRAEPRAQRCCRHTGEPCCTPQHTPRTLHRPI
jgi:hypothetical protein